jgi:hypothetical protein
MTDKSLNDFKLFIYIFVVYLITLSEDFIASNDTMINT